MVPFWMLLVRPAAGVSSGGAAFGLSSEGGGQDEICGQSPASPVRVKAGAPRVRKAEKDQTLFIFPGPLSCLFPLPSGFLLPGASRQHFLGRFSRTEESQTDPAPWRSWVGGEGRASRERVQERPGRLGQGKRVGREGCGPRRPVGCRPCLPGSLMAHFADRVPASWCVS